MDSTTKDPLARFGRRLPPFPRYLGIELISVEPDRLVAELTVREETSNGQGAMHGGAIMAVADTLGAIGTLINLPEGVGTTTLESKTNFIGAAPIGARLVAEATPLHRGRTTQVWQTRISRADGKLVAIVTQTQLVLAAPTRVKAGSRVAAGR
jgi:1,4-dihydroxy-2-naphthoyl-CoA hydrolase